MGKVRSFKLRYSDGYLYVCVCDCVCVCYIIDIINANSVMS